ncbi:MAG: glycosyltransferase family 2 protein [Cyclobacteriaceae bacterium]
MNKVKATVIIPTTIDRGMLLPFSVGSVQNQTVKDIEIFIIGDGVYDETREVIHDLQSKDSRIKFFDHPKHERRGEVYRHMALQEAKGEIVCYLCDRDLMLPDHIEAHSSALQSYDFSCSMHIRIRPDQKPVLDSFALYFGDFSENKVDLRVRLGGLSTAAHRLDFYKKLPFGWRATPEGKATDMYMWNQFYDVANFRAFSISEPTILYFKRKPHPGWSSAQRLPELIEWHNRLVNDIDIDHFKKETILELIKENKHVREKKNLLENELQQLKKMLDFHSPNRTYNFMERFNIGKTLSSFRKSGRLKWPWNT